MKIYNTLSKRKEEFVPLEEGKVKMYVCGPTVYNFIHIGNARPMIAFDTVRRYFEYKGFEVNFVSNFTDVDFFCCKRIFRGRFYIHCFHVFFTFRNISFRYLTLMM